MKILHVTPILGPANGGSAVIPLNLAIEQARLGHDVTIATSNYQYDQTTYNLPKGVVVESFECGNLLKFFYYTPKMKRWLMTNCYNFDLIHLHNFRSYQSLLLHKCTSKHDKPYIVHAHGSAKIVGGKNYFKRFFDMIWGRRIIARASACIAVSNFEIDHYIRLGASPDSIKVIPNALVTVTPSQLPIKGEYRKEHGITSEAKLILFVGRLNKIKGIDVLIRAFAQVHSQKQETILLIIGPDDGEESKLRTLVKSYGLENEVKFIGFMASPLPAYIDADLLAYPSRYEIFGLVPFEAILHGVPIVVSSENGCGEIVSEVGCGLTVPPDNVAALSDSILYLLNNPNEAQIMVQKGQAYIEEYLTWQKVTRQFDSVYLGAIKKCKREN